MADGTPISSLPTIAAVDNSMYVIIDTGLTLAKISVENLFSSGSAASSQYARRVIFRGRDLGASFTADQKAAIAAGTFDGLQLGDYWSVNGVKYRIVDFDYFYGKGSSSANMCNTHHVVVMPDSVLANGAMNSTNSTVGGYSQSTFFTGASGAVRSTHVNTIKNVFGSSYVLSKTEYFQSASNSSTYAPSDTTIVSTSEVELPSEIQMFGTIINGMGNTGAARSIRRTLSTTQFALFRVRPEYIAPNQQTFWLRDVASSTAYCCLDAYGTAAYGNATDARGHRPYFCLIGG